MNPNFVPLEELQIAKPCRADWQNMTGDEQTRFCGSCHKNVYDISQMTREAAQNLIREKEGKVCLRLHRRPDGTVITSDCPVGKAATARPQWWGVAALMAIVGAAMSGCASKAEPPEVIAPVAMLDHPAEVRQTAPQISAAKAETPPMNSNRAEPFSFANGSIASQAHSGVTMGEPMMPAPTNAPAAQPTSAPLANAPQTASAPMATETMMGRIAPVYPQTP